MLLRILCYSNYKVVWVVCMHCVFYLFVLDYFTIAIYCETYEANHHKTKLSLTMLHVLKI